MFAFEENEVNFIMKTQDTYFCPFQPVLSIQKSMPLHCTIPTGGYYFTRSKTCASQINCFCFYIDSSAVTVSE
jgi:hypothetical protein